MTTKNKLTLSNIMSNFKDSLEKEASEGTPEPEQLETNDLTGNEPEGQEKQAAEDTDDTGETQDKEAQDQAQDQDQDQDPEPETADVSALKKIASDAAEKESEDMKKEAEEFGTLFAHSFISEMEKHAQIEEAREAAYNNTMQALNDHAMQEKLAEVQNEAYTNTLSELARSEAYALTANHIQEKTAGEMPLKLAGVTQEAYDVTKEALDSLTQE